MNGSRNYYAAQNKSDIKEYIRNGSRLHIILEKTDNQ